MFVERQIDLSKFVALLFAGRKFFSRQFSNSRVECILAERLPDGAYSKLKTRSFLSSALISRMADVI
jgi:hypothetical protein